MTFREYFFLAPSLMRAPEEQLVNKEQLVTNQASQLEQGGSQRKNVEDSLAMTKHQVSSIVYACVSFV